MPVRAAKDTPAGPFQIVSAVSEETKNKPPDKLVAHPVYGLFWTGSSTLPRLHHPQSNATSVATITTSSLSVIAKIGAKKASFGASPITCSLPWATYTTAWSMVATTSYVGH